jgi:hypothetical protein
MSARPSNDGHGSKGRDVQAPGDDLWRELLANVTQLEQYAALYLRVREDRLRLVVRETVWRVAWKLAAVIVSAGVIVTAVVYVFDGTTRGLALVLGGRVWLASLMTGAAALLAFLTAVWAGRQWAGRTAHRHRVAEYEKLKSSFQGTAPRAGVPAPADKRGSGRNGPRTNGHRPQRSKAR